MIRGMRSRQSEMPIPTRTAPRPPGNPIDHRNTGWRNNDPFGPLTTLQPVQKKKPPPRPPPPRFKKDNTQSQFEKSKKPARPTELLTNLFGIKSSKQPQINVAYAGNRSQTAQSIQSNNLLDRTVSLIDLSPPGSPTFTTRSSSDGVSVDSFGSDGNSNPSMFTSSGNTSQTESAFEDDFDFFGNLSKRNAVQNDPWKGHGTTLDPFAPTSSYNQNMTTSTKQVGDSNFFAYNVGSTTSYTPPPTNNSMPTIIRARPPKPPAPKINPTSLAPTVPNFSVTSVPKSTVAYTSSSVFCDDVLSAWPSTASSEPYQRTNSSPPMPSIPPPAPPSEYLTEIESPRVNTSHVPQGVALYDFEASQSGDLSLKQGDIIILKSKVSDDWLQGQVGSRTGIFPANFIDITVPLPGLITNIVNALYKFNGETWEDLSFEEGAKITVLSKISDDWLYGEHDGKKGQFPTNYVDRVPHNLPTYS